MRWMKFAVVALLLTCIACGAGAAEFRQITSPDVPEAAPADAYIREWAVIGAFPLKPASDPEEVPDSWKSDVLDVTKLDSVEGTAAGYEWRTVTAPEGELQVDLLSSMGEKNNAVAYAACYVYAKEACARNLLLGSDDGVEVWLNGIPIFNNYTVRTCQPDQDSVRAYLNQGENLLVLKVTQAVRGWNFCARFDDNRGLSVSTEPDEATAKALHGSDAAYSSAPDFVIKPYLQHMTSGGVTIMWQSNMPARARVTIKQSHNKLFSKSWSSQYYEVWNLRRLNGVKITGLEPDHVYTYSVDLMTDAQKETKSPGEWTFRTFPNKKWTLRFIATGDSRSEPERCAEVIDAMNREKDIAFVIHVGDIVGDGKKLNLWVPEFFQPAAPMASRVPFFMALGNHENDSQYYFSYYDLPGNERYYSFDAGNIHLIALDSCNDFSEGSEQYEWLVDDLDKHRDARWKLVYMHHPVYTSGGHGRVGDDGKAVETAIRDAQELMPELAKTYGISAVFSGHDHFYERSERDRVQYVVTGGGGVSTGGQQNLEQNPYSKAFHSDLHYCVVSVDGPKASVDVRTPDGKRVDRFNLN